MKKVNLFIIIVALAVFLLLSFFSIPKSSLFSPSLKNLKPIEIGVLYKYCTTDAQCELNQKCFKNSCRNKLCVDTDGGIVPEVFGIVSVSLEGIPISPFANPDECIDSLNLKEFFCSENSDSANQIISCPGICQNGACVEAVCGDGIISSNEECDSNNLDGKTCADFGFDSGTLTCDSNCQFDTENCYNESQGICGDGTIDSGEECDDGNTIPLDGCDENCHLELTTEYFKKLFGGARVESGLQIIPLDDGYAVFGTTQYNASVFNTTHTRFWLVKTDLYGQTCNYSSDGECSSNGLFAKVYGFANSYNIIARTAIRTSDGGFLLYGTLNLPQNIGRPVIIKTNSMGQTCDNNPLQGECSNQNTFIRFLGNPAEQYPFAASVVETSDGGFMVMFKNSQGMNLVKTDSQGITCSVNASQPCSLGPSMFVKRYTGSMNNPNAIIQTSDGGYFILSSAMFGGTGTRPWLLKTNSTGDSCTSTATVCTGDGVFSIKLDTGVYQSYGGVNALQETFNAAHQSTGYVLAGQRSYNFHLLKLTPLGDIEFSEAYGNSGTAMINAFAQSVRQTFDSGVPSGYILAGFTNQLLPIKKAYIVKTDINGQTCDWIFGKCNGVGENNVPVFAQYYDEAFEDEFLAVERTFDGGYIAVGKRQNDMLVIKTNQQGLAGEEAVPEKVSCGDTLNVSYSLQEDIENCENGIIINEDGITLDCQNRHIRGTSQPDSFGINLNGHDNVTIKNCLISHFHYGIENDGSYNEITGNIVSDSVQGIFVSGSANKINKNSILDNSQNAYDSGFGNSWNSTSLGNYWSDFSTNPGYPNNYQIPGTGDGIDYSPQESPFNQLSCPSNLSFIGSARFLYNNITDCAGGIKVSGDSMVIDCRGHTIDGIGNGTGVILESVTGVQLKNCRIREFREGVYIHLGTINTVKNNLFELNSLVGLYTSGSIVNKIEENVFQANSMGIYLMAQSDGTILRNNTFQSTGDSVLVSSSTGCRILDNKVWFGATGISLMGSIKNKIINNSLHANSIGIELTGISGGETPNSNENQITDNDILNSNIDGISFGGSSAATKNIISANTISGNEGYGINVNVDGVDNNIFFRNTFSDNALGNAYEVAGAVNSWNSTSLGNYWSDFSTNPGYPNNYQIPGPGIGIDYYPNQQ